MAKVSVSKQINVPAASAWKKLASFRGIEDFSPIERSETIGEGEGAKRTCYMPDGAVIHEVLNKVDNNNMEFQYAITEGPFPISGYLSTVKVEPVNNTQAKVTWGSQYEVGPEAEEAMLELFSGFYDVMIDGLEKLIREEN